MGAKIGKNGEFDEFCELSDMVVSPFPLKKCNEMEFFVGKSVTKRKYSLEKV